MNTLVSRALYNKHTSISGLVYIALAAIDGIGTIWFPDFGDKIADTTSYLRQAAVGYALLSAGDAAPSETSDGKAPTQDA